MSISSVNSTSQAAQVQQIQSTQAAPKAAADGDRKVAGPNTAKTKDADGDYKLVRATAAVSSSGVQAALSNLKAGG